MASSGSVIIRNNIIPAGAKVTFTAFHQAEWVQIVDVKDSKGNSIAFYTPSNPDQPLASFPIRGAGVQFAAFNEGVGWFMMPQDQISITFTHQNNGVEASTHIGMGPNYLYNPDTGNLWGGTYSFGVEDGGGNDYDDTSFTLAWFHAG